MSFTLEFNIVSKYVHRTHSLKNFDNSCYFYFILELVSTSGPSHAPQFVIRASLNDMSFEGSGKSKKDAKLNASKALLVHLHQVGFDPMTGDMMSTQQNNTDVASGHSFADKIGQMVRLLPR